MTQLSTTTFGIALGCYFAGMLGYFVYLGARRTAIYRVANALAWVGFASQLTSVIARAIAAHRVPWGTMYEFSTLSSLVVVGAELLFIEARNKVRTVGGFALAYAVCTMAIATLFFYTDPEPLPPVLESVWLKIHVFAIAFSSSLLILGSGVITPLYLWKRWRENRAGAAPAKAVAGGAKPDDLGAPSDLAADDVDAPVVPAALTDEARGARRTGILPSSDKLDRMAAGVITTGFFIFTFAVIAGAIWAEHAWGRYWNWDPKETWAFVTWAIFAGYLHARSTVDWKGKRAAIIALVGFAAMLVTYYGVNLLMKSLHSYAGLPQ